MQTRHALTKLELLVVLIIFGGIIAILMPSGGSPRQAKLVRCLTNLKTQGTAFLIYSMDNAAWPDAGAGIFRWLNEQSLPVHNAFARNVPPRNDNISKPFYCPANTAQEPEKLWQRGNLSVWGYAWLNDRGPTATGMPALPSSLAYRAIAPKTNTSKTILATDVVVSNTTGSPADFTAKVKRADAPGGSLAYQTNHITGKVVTCNVLYADGHVESEKSERWRPVAIMQSPGAYFWIPTP